MLPEYSQNLSVAQSAGVMKTYVKGDSPALEASYCTSGQPALFGNNYLLSIFGQ